MSTFPATLLVVAKAPVAGLAKTRLCPPLTPHQSATLAAAALLDTLDAVAATGARHRVIALTGDLRDAECATDVRRRVADFTVIRQRGDGFAARLANAHADTAALFDGPVLQIGMDTPQVGPDILVDAVELLDEPGVDGVLGPAVDGGWWALGLRDPRSARFLDQVPMSRPDTGAVTRATFGSHGARLRLLPELRDVDTSDDVREVAQITTPDSRFRASVAALANSLD